LISPKDYQKKRIETRRGQETQKNKVCNKNSWPRGSYRGPRKKKFHGRNQQTKRGANPPILKTSKEKGRVVKQLSGAPVRRHAKKWIKRVLQQVEDGQGERGDWDT